MFLEWSFIHKVPQYGGRLVAKLHHTLHSIRVSLRYLGTVLLFGYGIVFSFRYGLFICGLFIWVHCMIVSFGYGVFIQVWSPYLGIVFSFRYIVFSFGYGVFIWVWCFHSGMVSLFGYSLFISCLERFTRTFVYQST